MELCGEGEQFSAARHVEYARMAVVRRRRKEFGRVRIDDDLRDLREAVDRLADLPSGLDVTDLRVAGLVMGGDTAAVRTERHGVRQVLVLKICNYSNGGAGGGVVDTYRVIHRQGEPPPAPAEDDAPSRVVDVHCRGDLTAGVAVPDVYVLV